MKITILGSGSTYGLAFTGNLQTNINKNIDFLNKKNLEADAVCF